MWVRTAASLVAALVAAIAGPALGAAGTAGAQPAASAARPSAYATRAALTQSLADARRRGARDEADRLRERLTAGDMRPGDRLAVTLTVDSTRVLDLVVRDSQRVDVPPFAPLSLRGVLRSELQPAVLRYFRQYYRDPDVRVQPLLRVGVLGAVGRPGYYAIAPDAFVTDLLTEKGGGGAAGNADQGKIELKRGSQKVLDRKGYQRAAREGLTLADVGVRSGDELRVPERKNRSSGQIIQNVFFGISAVTSLLFLVRAFYNN
jgi:protein involved in polysaccharide export with SLBB domain